VVEALELDQEHVSIAVGDSPQCRIVELRDRSRLAGTSFST